MKKINQNKLGTFASLLMVTCLLVSNNALGWDTVARDTGYQPTQNPTLFVGDTFDLGWDIGSGYNQAQYGLGTVNAASSLTYQIKAALRVVFLGSLRSPMIPAERAVVHPPCGTSR